MFHLIWGLLLFHSADLMAFTLTNSGRVTFPSPEIKILVSSNICDLAGMNSPAELQSLIQESVDTYWNAIPTCALKLEMEGISSVDTSNLDLEDTLRSTPVGKILVGCSANTDTFDSAGVLGVGSINTINGDRGALLINNVDTSFANLDRSEKIATIAHELGHAFGIGHSSDPAALMYFSIGGKIQKNLTIDDYDACSWLYPHEDPVGCGSIQYIDDSSFKGPRGFRNSQKPSTSSPFSVLSYVFVGFLLSLFLRWKRVS